MSQLVDLIEGYRRFRKEGYPVQQARYEKLANHGQAPKHLIISCSDSRVDPSQIFDVDPGEIFVVRNVAALVPPFETTPGLHGVSAALEFAVNVLEVREIVVMGHGMCGGCLAALSQDLKGAAPGEGGFVASWISMLDEARKPVVEKHGSEGRTAERAMELAAVKVSLTNLRSFPFVQKREAEGKLSLHGAFFAINEGVLHLLDNGSGEFSPVE